MLLAEQEHPITWLLPLFMVAGWLGFALLTVMLIRGRIERRQRERPSPREMIDAVKQRSGRSQAARELDRGDAAALQSIQRLAVLIDNKAERIEQLLAEADDRIMRLRQLTRDIDGVAAQQEAIPSPASTPPSTAAAPAADEPTASTPPADAHLDHRQADGADQPPPHAGGRVDDDDHRPPLVSATAELRDPLTTSVYELADEGLTPVEIAQQLDEQIGKVELILALRRG